MVSHRASFQRRNSRRDSQRINDKTKHGVPGAQGGLEGVQGAAILQSGHPAGEDHLSIVLGLSVIHRDLNESLIAPRQMIGIIGSEVSDPLGDGSGDLGELSHIGVERGGIRTVNV